VPKLTLRKSYMNDVKILIIVACAIAASEGLAHSDIGDEVAVTKEDAGTLTRNGRALYLDKANDPTKGLLTADVDQKKKIKDQVKAIAAVTEAKAAAALQSSPQGLGALIAAAIEKAVQAAAPIAAK
jgi:hypothetical protein